MFLRSVGLFSLYLLLCTLLEVEFPEDFEFEGCAPKAHLKDMRSKGGVVFLTPKKLMYPFFLDLLAVSLGKDYVYGSYVYRCAESIGRALTEQAPPPPPLSQELEYIKRVSTQVGLGVATYDDFDLKQNQALQLVSSIMEMEPAFQRNWDALEKAFDDGIKQLGSIDEAASVFFEMDESLLKAAENAPRKYQSLKKCLEDGKEVGLSEEFQAVLDRQGIDHTGLHKDIRMSFDLVFEKLRAAFYQKDEKEAMLMALEVIENHAYFRNKVTQFLTKEPFARSIKEASPFIDEMFVSLLKAESLSDILKYLQAQTDQSFNFESPVNYALLDKWATLGDSGKDVQNGPRNALLPQEICEDAWFFGTGGQLDVEMVRPVKPTLFIILSPQKSHEINPSALPSQVKVWGRSSGGVYSQLASQSIPIVSSGVNPIPINHTNNHFYSFRLEILSNHGHPQYTRLHQFIIHGQL